MKKKIINLILCSALALSGAVTANAYDINSSSFVDLKTECYIPEGTMLVSGYNIDADHPGAIRYTNSEENFNLDLTFNNCAEIPQTVSFNKNILSCMVLISAKGNPGAGASDSIADCESGKYKKIRIKLSDFSDNFTEDGKIVYNRRYDGTKYTSDLRKKTNSKGTYYGAFCVIKSGAAHTAVIPDENGEAEFYISTNPLHKTRIIYDITNLVVSLADKINIQFGDTDNSGYTDVKDVTQIQLALTGAVTLDDYGKFNADINLDEIYDVKDVTALQIALAEKAN